MNSFKLKSLITVAVTLFALTLSGPTLAQDSSTSTDGGTAEITTTTTTSEVETPPATEVQTTNTTVEDTTTTVTSEAPSTEVETRSLEVKSEDEVMAVEPSNQGLFILGGLLLVGVIVGIVAALKK